LCHPAATKSTVCGCTTRLTKGLSFSFLSGRQDTVDKLVILIPDLLFTMMVDREEVLRSRNANDALRVARNRYL
jgi:hypothetical protein